MSSRSGELAMRPLPAVLLDLHEELATGRLQLRRGRVSKSVDLVNGNPVSTTSTPRDETLGHFLVNSGVITEDQHRFAVGRTTEVGGKLGEALVALQILTVEALIDQLGKQARHKLVQALRWPQGAWRFDESFDPIEGMQLRMVEVVLGGLRETSIETPERLSRLDALTFELTPRGKHLKHELKRAYGEALVIALGRRATIADVEKAMGDRARARMAVDAMLLCDAVTSAAVEVGLGSGDGYPRADSPVFGGRAPTRPALGRPNPLYDMLFDDLAEPDDGVSPLEFEEVPTASTDDSGIVPTHEVEHSVNAVSSARQAIAAEHQRLRGADHYAVLMIGQRSTAGDIQSVYDIRMSMLERDGTPLGEARDRAKIDEIRAFYGAARATLVDEARRRAYDRELAGGELVQVPPAIDTELGFRIAEDLMGRKKWPEAIGHLKTVIQRSPNEADYHAALGWAEWKANGEHEASADNARQHLNHALSIDPDHAAAHDYKGRIGAALRGDETEAIFHLERALDLDPTRGEALSTIEDLLVAKGELRRLERVLKRQLFRLRDGGGATEAHAWLRLAKLYLEHLGDPASAAAAGENAHKLAPKDVDVVMMVARVEHAKRMALQPVREGWREALEDPHHGAALVRSTAASGHADAAFLAASTMIALGTADQTMTDLYETYRARGVVMPARALGREQWTLLRHKEDTVELGALFELVAPAVHALAPMTLGEGGVEDSALVPDSDLPPVFAKLRASYATLLGVPAAPVYAKVELGMQVHVVACDPPVLVAGDDVLTSPERVELVFRVARAMTFLWPGRAVGASRPGRVLRAIMLAVFREAGSSELGLDEPLAPRATAAVAALPEESRTQARAAALRLLSRGTALNLSLWSRSLSRTADRAGMLLCADVPAAFAGAREAGDLERDLIEFAYSAAHVNLRAQLGLSSV